MKNIQLNRIIIFLLAGIIALAFFYRSNEYFFDGTGKSFGQFHFPQKCCKSQNCYPGMYVSNDFTSETKTNGCQCDKCQTPIKFVDKSPSPSPCTDGSRPDCYPNF